MHAHEIYELGRCGEIFDLSLSVPVSRRIGDALATIFGVKLNAKSVTDPWGTRGGVMISKGGCNV
jgi:hypothetical protein